MPTDATNLVLFLCTGNYYRSRFAESYFAHLAEQSGLNWRADSRALALERGACNIGPISPFARSALAVHGVLLPEPCRLPIACTTADLQEASLIVALKEIEHRPLLADRHPGWADRVRYWHVHDVDQAPPDVALLQVAEHVRELVAELSQAKARS